MRKNSQEKSLARNGVIYLIYNVLNVLFPFATGVYVARVLMPENVGQISYAQNIVQYFVILAFLGLPTYGLREIAKARNDKEKLNKLYSELFIINFISTAIFSLAYLVLILSVPTFSENLNLYLIVGLLVVFNALNNTWLYEGREDFSYITLLNLVFKVVSFVLLILFVREFNDWLIYAGITVVGTAGSYIINVIHARKFVKFTFKGLNFRKHLKPIFYLVAVNLAIEIYMLIDVTMLGFFCSDDKIAFYSYGSKIYKIFIQILNTFTIVLVPRIANLYKNGQNEEFNLLLSKATKVIILFALPLVLGLIFVSDFVITKIYGLPYAESAGVLKILAFSLIMTPLGYLLGSRVLLVAEKESKMLICVSVGAIANVIGNYVLIRLYGINGAAIATVTSETLVGVIYVLLGKKYFNLKGVFTSLLKILLGLVLMLAWFIGLSYTSIDSWSLLGLQVLGGAGIYFLTLFALKEDLVLSTVKKFMGRKDE